MDNRLEDKDNGKELCYDCGDELERGIMYRKQHPIYKYVYYLCDECYAARGEKK